MKFKFTEKKVKVNPEVLEYAEKKIAKLDKFFREESDASIVFSSLRGRMNAEITLHNNGMFYRVTETTSDMHATIDSAVAAIERQIRKNKTKLSKRLRDVPTIREDAFAPEEADVVEEDGADAENEQDFKIVRSKRFPIKPMTPQEAVLQMNLLGHEFYLFKNQEQDEKFSIVYKRVQGDYGMIESIE